MLLRGCWYCCAHDRSRGPARPLGSFLHIQKTLDHIDHLRFFRVAVACDCLFDLHGRVFKHRDAALITREQNNTAAMRHSDAGGYIFGKKQFFNRYCVRSERVDQLFEVLVDHIQTWGKRRIGRRRYNAAGNVCILSLCCVDHAESDGADPRVNA